MVEGTDGFEHILKVTELDIRGVKVRLGFEIHVVVPVHRSELWDRIFAAGRFDCPPDGDVPPVL